MWILLEEGDVIREGDQFWREKTDMWMPMSLDTYYFGARVNEEHPPMRRKLTGWEAVKHAIKAEVLGNDKEGCETTMYFWNCECEHDYINRYTDNEEECPVCGACAGESSDARKADVILEIIEEEE